MTADLIGKKEFAAILRKQARYSEHVRTRPWRVRADMVEDAIAHATEVTLRGIADALDPPEKGASTT